MINKSNENPISSAWEKRYSELTPDIRQRLEVLNKMKPKDYQLRVIKKSKVVVNEEATEKLSFFPYVF